VTIEREWLGSARHEIRSREEDGEQLTRETSSWKASMTPCFVLAEHSKGAISL
jgi:hypothetical protein